MKDDPYSGQMYNGRLCIRILHAQKQFRSADMLFV